MWFLRFSMLMPRSCSQRYPLPARYRPLRIALRVSARLHSTIQESRRTGIAMYLFGTRYRQFRLHIIDDSSLPSSSAPCRIVFASFGYTYTVVDRWTTTTTMTTTIHFPPTWRIALFIHRVFFSSSQSVFPLAGLVGRAFERGKCADDTYYNAAPSIRNTVLMYRQ